MTQVNTPEPEPEPKHRHEHEQQQQQHNDVQQPLDEAITFKTSALADHMAELSTAADPPAADLTNLRNHVVNTLREWYVLATDSITTLLEGRLLSPQPTDLWLLGKHYELTPPAPQPADSEQEPTAAAAAAWSASPYPDAVLQDFRQLIWCTYRSQYPPIAPSAFTSDAGWGCMLRAGQTLLAQALQMHHFGRDWAFDWDTDSAKQAQYVDIVKQFFDDYAQASLFSIHRMASLGKQREGKDIGQWFGPFGTASIIKELAASANHELRIYTTTDGVVYLADLCHADDFQPTLILAASMLGTDRVNPIYYPFIQASLTLPQSAGIAGGRPNSALYFAGFQGDELVYLDPHYTRPAVPHHADDQYSKQDLESYSCDTPRRIPVARIDPCMVFGFYCRSLEALIDLRTRIDMLTDEGMHTIVSFDNGFAPVVEFSPEPPSEDEAAREPSLLVKLPASDSEAEAEVDAGRSDASEIVLAGDSTSEDDWVTDL